jgi:hypothetical protein
MPRLQLAIGITVLSVLARTETAIPPQPARTSQQGRVQRVENSLPPVSAARRQQLADAYGKLPLTFEANQGQTDRAFQFFARGNGYSVFLAPTESVMTLHAPTNTDGAVLQMTLLGSNPKAPAIGLEKLPGKSNYFVGNDRKQWRTAIPNYAKVRFVSVYRGVDLVYYGNQRQLEYDFVVAPGADASAIALGFGGAERLEVDAQGELALHTGAGDVRWRKPVIYQTVAGVRHEVNGQYVRRGKTAVGFEVASYDRHYPLIIDPALVYSTYLGGSSFDDALGIAIDSSGNAYVTGFTQSVNFPTRNTAPLFRGLRGSQDAFVTKLDPTGTSVVYSTYMGGTGTDGGNAIAVDSGGFAYVTGFTNSSDFPHNTTLRGWSGGQDAFVIGLSASGSFGFGTYLGGTGDDSGLGIVVDSLAHIYVMGTTTSTDFPTTPGAFQTTVKGSADYFVTRLDGGRVAYSTYLGGSGIEGLFSSSAGIALDSSNNVYVTGTTPSADFPTRNPIQPALSGSGDAFVTKLNPTLSGLVYSTYLGGSGVDSGVGIAVDSSGNAYVTGQTNSIDFPTLNPIQPVFGGGNDAFVTKLNAQGSALVYSTYLGGSGTDSATGVAVDASGNAYITGGTQSPDFPITFDAIQPAFGGGFGDAFVTRLNAAGSVLAYSTFLGGSSNDGGTGIVVDTSGNAFVSGGTGSVDFPTVAGLQMTSGGGNDAFVTKIGGIGPGGTVTATLTSIFVTPVNPTIFAGNTQPFTATGVFSDSTEKDVTTSVTWGSQNPSAATITSAGLATGVDWGTSLISATSGNISGSTTVTVINLAKPIDYTISVPQSLALSASSTGTSAITLRSLNGISETVALAADWVGTSVAAIPFGVNVAISPLQVSVPSTGSVSSTLTVTTSGSPSFGTFTLRVRGTSLTNTKRSVDLIVTITSSSQHTCCMGHYVAPAPGVSIAASDLGVSPGGKYEVVDAGGAPAGLSNLIVKRTSDQHVVLNNIQAAFWGFSPDDDRFVTHWVQDPGGASIDQVALYDLTRATPLIWSGSDSTHSSRIQFSPSGRYFFYTDVFNGQTQLTLIDAHTGTKEFTQSISQSAGAPVAGQDSFGIIDWGFGPDDSRFVFAYVSAQTPQTDVQWNLVNLQTGPAHALVKNVSLIGETADYWQFSPCGDVIGLVHQPGQQSVQIDVYNTKDGSAAGSAQIPNPVQLLELHATSTSQVATANGSTDYMMGANTAPCPTPAPPPPSSGCCTGPYVDAAQGVAIANKAGASPSGKYVVETSAGATGLANVTVRRSSDQQIVLTGIQAAFWGFSPDDDRFVTHWVEQPGSTSIDHVGLYDLASAYPASPIWADPMPSTQSSRILFSPSGNYLLYTYVGGDGKTHLTLVDARTGAVAFTDDSIPLVTGAPVAGQDSFGTIGWGFGPNDNRFVYGFLSTPNVTQLNLVNLETKAVKSISLNGETGDYWQFSPCGDVIALVHQLGQQGVWIEVYNTKDGSSAGPGAQIPAPIQSLQLHATSTLQVATNGSLDYTLAANNGSCPASVSAHSPVNILVVDDQGRRSGFDPVRGTAIDEIPGASYTGIGTEPQTVTLPYAAGTYVLDAYGLDSLTSPEPYRLTVETGSDTSNLTDLHELSGIASKGSSQQFVIVIGDHGTITTFTSVDTTPPLINPIVSGTLGNNGWYTSDVSVSWSVTDAQSPIGSTSGCSPVSVTSGTSGMTFTCTATSAGGTASSSVTIKRDATAPSIVVTAPAGPYLLGQIVAANYSCSDGGSGVASCSGTVPNGASVNTAVVGANTFTVNATDQAGNSITSSASYTVAFNVCPLYDANLAKKSGSAYPIKLQLCDAVGQNLSSSSIVVHAVGVTQVSSNTAAALDDTGNANPDFDFRYDVVLGGYIFNLSTNGYLTGTYTLNFTAGSDPTVHSALFAVK